MLQVVIGCLAAVNATFAPLEMEKYTFSPNEAPPHWLGDDPGDWDPLNKLLSRVSVHVPDQHPHGTNIGICELRFDVTNIYCPKFNYPPGPPSGDFKAHPPLGLESADAGSEPVDPKKWTQGIFLGSDTIHVDCRGHVHIVCGHIPSVDADFHAWTPNAILNIFVTFFAEPYKTFATYPPTRAESPTDGCSMKTNLDFDISGSIPGVIANTFKSTFRSALNNAISNSLCNGLRNEANTIFNQLLTLLNDYIIPALPDSNNTDIIPHPLEGERNLVGLNPPPLVDFFDDNAVEVCVDVAIKKVCVGILDEGKEQVQKYLREPGGSPGMNSFVRNHSGDGFAMTGGELFGKNHSFNVTMNWLVVNSSEQLSNVNVTVLNITAYNLDNFDQVEVLLDAVEGSETGHHSFRFTVHIPTVDIEVWTNVNIWPASVVDPVIISQVALIETTRARSTLSDLSLDFTLMAAVDAQKLEDSILGELYDDPTHCGFAMLFEPGVNVTALTATMTNFSSPVVDNFVCTGCEEVLSKLVDAAMVMYRDSVVLAVPGLAESKIRYTINEELHKKLQDPSTTRCPPRLAPPQVYVDFSSNGLFTEVAKNVHKYIADNGVNGIISNATKSASGMPGVLNMSGFHKGFDVTFAQSEIHLAADLSIDDLAASGLVSVSHARIIEPCPPPNPPATPSTESPTVVNETLPPLAPTQTPTSSPSGFVCEKTGPYELFNNMFLADNAGRSVGYTYPSAGCMATEAADANACEADCAWDLQCKAWSFAPEATNVTQQGCCLYCTAGSDCQVPAMQPTQGGVCGRKGVVVRTGLGIDIDSSVGVHMHEKINLTLSMQGIEAELQVFLQVVEDRLRGLSIGQLRNPECLVSTLETGGLSRLNISFQSIALALTHNCTNCSAVHQEYMATIAHRATTARGIDELTTTINLLAEKILGVLAGAQTATQLQKRVASAGSACRGSTYGELSNWMPGANIPGNDLRCTEVKYTDAHVCQSACSYDLRCKAWTFKNSTSQDNSTHLYCCMKSAVSGVELANNSISGVKPPPDNTSTKMPKWLIALIACILGSILLGIIVYGVWRCRYVSPMEVEDVWLMEGEQGSSHGGTDVSIAEACCLQWRRAFGRSLWGDGDASKLPSSRRPPSLFRDPSLPCWLRYGMPLLLLGTLGLFASSHVSLGAAVDFEIKFTGDVLNLREFTSFSIVHSVIEMWGAGAIPLALLVLVFSVLWPYTKVVMLTITWFKPMPLGRRGNLIRVLDTLGKWSFIDVYVLVLSLIAFNMNVYSPYRLEYLLGGREFYAVQSRVRPLWGLYSFILGVLASLILNLIVNFSNQRATEKSDLPRHKKRVDPYQLGGPCLHQFLLLFLAVASMGLVAGAAAAPSFTFQVQGLAGIAMEAGQEGGSKTSYALLDIVNKMSSQAKEMEGQAGMGMYFIVAIYGAISLGFPLLHVAVLGVGYFIGLMRWIGSNGKRRVLHLHEVCSAFSALPVYFIAIVVSLLEIGQVSDFMVGSACDGLDATFSDFLVPYGFILQSDATCFHIAASLDSGVGALLAAIIVKWFTCKVIVHQLEADIDSPDPLWDSVADAREDHCAGPNHDFVLPGDEVNVNGDPPVRLEHTSQIQGRKGSPIAQAVPPPLPPAQGAPPPVVTVPRELLFGSRRDSNGGKVAAPPPPLPPAGWQPTQQPVSESVPQLPPPMPTAVTQQEEPSVLSLQQRLASLRQNRNST
eukprot:Hpha_TRINITY_DN15848_c4_g16::TRINITY_DN15848_c4_g16_i1::g.189038::m.189038